MKFAITSVRYSFIKSYFRLQRTKTSPTFIVGELLYRNHNRLRPNAIDEAKEYFHRAIRHGKQAESLNKLAEIYKTENNLPKAIEMLESTLQ